MSLDVPTLRSFLVGKAGVDGLTVGLDPTVTNDALAKQLASAATPPQDASISIVNGVPTPAPGHPGAKCCAVTAPDVLFAALARPPDQPGRPPARRGAARAVDRSAERARPQGGRRGASRPSTRPARPASRTSTAWPTSCAERSSGLVRSSRSTSWWGSAPKRRASSLAPAIAEGVHEDEVGGGVSQFATTLFNAVVLRGARLRAVPEPQPLHLPLSVRS